MNKNIDVLQKSNLLFDDIKIADFTTNLQLMAQQLTFYQESEVVPSELQWRKLLLALLDPSNTVAAQLSRFLFTSFCVILSIDSDSFR